MSGHRPQRLEGEVAWKLAGILGSRCRWAGSARNRHISGSTASKSAACPCEAEPGVICSGAFRVSSLRGRSPDFSTSRGPYAATPSTHPKVHPPAGAPGAGDARALRRPRPQHLHRGGVAVAIQQRGACATVVSGAARWPAPLGHAWEGAGNRGGPSTRSDEGVRCPRGRPSTRSVVASQPEGVRQPVPSAQSFGADELAESDSRLSYPVRSPKSCLAFRKLALAIRARSESAEQF